MECRNDHPVSDRAHRGAQSATARPAIDNDASLSAIIDGSMLKSLIEMAVKYSRA